MTSLESVHDEASVCLDKKMKLDKEKKKEIEAVLQNTERLRETDVVLSTLLQKTTEIREGLSEQYTEALHYFGKNFLEVPDSGQYLLSAIVNNAKALAASLGEGV